MWVCALADVVTLEVEYPPWVVYNHLLTQTSCIITRNLFLRSWSFFQKNNLEDVSFHLNVLEILNGEIMASQIL